MMFSKRTFGLIAIAAALTLNGCLEIETTTVVRGDGTVTRTVIVTGDSSSISEGRHLLSLDTTWRRDFRKKDERNYELVAVKSFEDPGEMNESLRGTKGTTLDIRVDFGKQFYWFFTRYFYRETWRKFNPFDTIPMSQYLSPKEIELFQKHEILKEPFESPDDSLALQRAQERFMAWQNRNVFEDFYAEFLNGVKALADPSLTAEDVETRKEELFEGVENLIEVNAIDTLPRVFGAILRSPLAVEAVKKNAAGFERFRRKMEFVQEIMENSYKNAVVMPGLIVETNAPAIEGNRVSWDDFIAYCYFGDYEMTVESRAVNWLVVVLTGAFCVAILVFYIVGNIRKRRKSREEGF